MERDRDRPLEQFAASFVCRMDDVRTDARLVGQWIGRETSNMFKAGGGLCIITGMGDRGPFPPSKLNRWAAEHNLRQGAGPDEMIDRDGKLWRGEKCVGVYKG
jgi:hypothetical protein